MEETLKFSTVLIVIVFELVSILPARAIVTDTASYWDGSSYAFSFGEPNTSVYGQTFITPSNDYILDSVTVYINDFLNPDYIDFGFYVMEWENTAPWATGSILYQDGKYTTTNNGGADGFEKFTFNTGGLKLNPSSEYVFFLCTSNYFNGSTGTSSMGLVGDVYSGGAFVFHNTNSHFELVTTTNWGIWPNKDLAFTAEFSAPASTPIPGAAWLFGSGMLSLIALKRLKKA